MMLACICLGGCSSGGPETFAVNRDAVAIAPTRSSEGELWLIPSAEPGFDMRARVFRPAGIAPFRLALINHGTEQDPSRRKKAKPPEFARLTSWFLKRGYVVILPERPGHGSGGKYLEDQRGCAGADFERAGQGAADSIAAAVDYMKKQPFISPEGIVVAGHSAGAWGSLAYAARRPEGVGVVINFSGGRGGRHLNRPLNNCAPERLVATAAVFGRTTSIPTLWLYAANDTFFPPPLSEAMVKGFRDAGGNAEFHLLSSFGNEGHFIIQSDTWTDILEQFLGTHG